MVESVIETASGSTSVSGHPNGPLSSRPPGYFSEPEARIIDHMMFGMSSTNGDGEEGDGEEGDGDGSAAAMEYSEIDLSTQFGRDAARGHHVEHRGAAQQQQQHKMLELGPSARRGGQEQDDEEEQQERRRMLALASRARLAIRRSIMRTSKAVPSMRFPQMMACGMVFACRAATSNPWCCAAGFVGAR